MRQDVQDDPEPQARRRFDLPPSTTQKDWTRVLIRPGTNGIKKLQEARLPLAKVYNMEFDLTCKK